MQDAKWPPVPMKTRDFDFLLPPELIALRPAEPRGAGRLLVVRPDGSFEHRLFQDLPLLLRRGDMLTLNDSRVIQARLTGRRPSRLPGAPDVPVEITLHKRMKPDSFVAFAQPAKRLRIGDRLDFGRGLAAEVVTRDGGEIALRFDRDGAALDAAIADVGTMPLPPYIASKRTPDARDYQDYQTIYAAQAGSVAAPTAGLHFTPAMMDRLAAAGVDRAQLTLHVGAGTFLPVMAEDTSEHRMHGEQARLDDATAQRLNQSHAAGGRIVAVGTTALRTLESAATPDGVLHGLDAETDIFITPGYQFRAVDVLLTNFHLPRSTLFMLVSAFMGLEVMQAAYAEAIAKDYRFYSYGDACLLVRSA